MEINRKSGVPKIFLIDHNVYRCEDNLMEWTDTAVTQKVYVNTWNMNEIDTWLHEQGFQWREEFREATNTHDEL